MDTIKVDGQEVPLIYAKTKTIIKHKKTGEQYSTEEEWKAKGINVEDIQRDVTVTLPRLDLFAKTKQIEHLGKIMAITDIISEEVETRAPNLEVAR